MNTNTKRITHYITALISVICTGMHRPVYKISCCRTLKGPAYVLIRNIFQLEYLENRGAALVYCKTRRVSFTSVYS